MEEYPKKIGKKKYKLIRFDDIKEKTDYLVSEYKKGTDMETLSIVSRTPMVYLKEFLVSQGFSISE